ncbi:MAG: hypothetical protein K0R02_623 [Rickettsiaceae bacterium]|jgi:hypothetical protein|nr:hypothetical protein [Rickettsiaceae bacterium]
MNSSGMILLKVPGWDDSWGLKQYHEICKTHDIAIYDLTPERLDEDITFIASQIQ